MEGTSVLRLSLLILITLLLTGVQCQDEFPTITLAQGTLKGRKVNSSAGSPFYSFQGIPYAKPPLRDLRFKAPVPPDPWNGTLKAFQEGNICRQFNAYENTVVGSEDCLYIHVFTPQLPGSEPLKPVMVFIHGGGFKAGSGGTDSFGPDYLVNAGVVLATFNYRLDILGFLSTEDAAVPGNAGMKDQVQALRWVQQNIAAFGGDPKKVTIFGHSAGGAAVMHHVLSPMSTGLISGGIAQSGSAISPWALAVKPRESAFMIGRALGYSGNSSVELVDFLRTITCRQLIETAQEAIPDRDKPRFLKLVFLPSVEPAVEGESNFLPDTPMNLLEQGNIHNVPFITGITSAEGIIFLELSGILRGPERLMEYNKNLLRTIKPELRFCKENLCGDDMVERIKSFYFGDQNLNNGTLGRFVELYSDLFFNEGVLNGVNKVASQKATPTYLYHFSHDGGLGYFKKRVGVQGFSGVSHADELGYLYDTPLTAAKGSIDDKVRSRLISMWTNFAKTGNPTPENSDEIPTWTPYTNSDKNYLDIWARMEMKKDLLKQRMDFWTDLYNQTETS